MLLSKQCEHMLLAGGSVRDAVLGSKGPGSNFLPSEGRRSIPRHAPFTVRAWRQSGLQRMTLD